MPGTNGGVDGSVLLIGGNSLLGHYLRATIPDDVDLHATSTTKQVGPGASSWHQLDFLDDPKDICRIVRSIRALEWVILTAAVGDVDAVEQDTTEESWKVNVEAVRHIVSEAEELGAKVLYVSSNAVYRGDAPLYREGDQRRPVNVYGWMRVMAEEIVSHHNRDYAIVRPILLYGEPEPNHRGNWVKRCLELWKEGKEVTPVDDIMTQPLYAEDCALFIWQLLNRDRKSPVGEWNIGGLDRVTYLEYTRAIAEVFKVENAKIRAIKSVDLSLPAPRPVDTSYDLQKVRDFGFEVKGLREGLEAMRQEAFVVG